MSDDLLDYTIRLESAIRMGCPFCGAPRKHLSLQQKRDDGCLFSWVECEFCGARGARSHRETGGPAGAVFDWNRRATRGAWFRPCSSKPRDAFIARMEGCAK
jgi:hypothetical protein